MSEDFTQAEVDAQAWHEGHCPPGEGSCYCCCWRCNDGTEDANPHYRKALDLPSNGARE